jgi:hypothetical protein
MLYDMKRQLHEGEAFEAALNAYFRSCGYLVLPMADRSFQTAGIDAVLVQQVKRRSMTVEYKADWQTARTGNCFIETEAVRYAEHVGRDVVKGWAVTSCAEYVAYCAVGMQLMLLPAKAVRHALPDWLGQYKERSLTNFNPTIQQNYRTTGVCVPLAAVAPLSVLTVPWDDLMKSEAFEQEFSPAA